MYIFSDALYNFRFFCRSKSFWPIADVNDNILIFFFPCNFRGEKMYLVKLIYCCSECYHDADLQGFSKCSYSLNKVLKNYLQQKHHLISLSYQHKCSQCLGLHFKTIISQYQWCAHNMVFPNIYTQLPLCCSWNWANTPTSLNVKTTHMCV